MRECPWCQHQQKGSARKPQMTCKSCNKEYCFKHANAHVGMTCEEYEEKHKEEFEANRRAIGKSQECPECGIIISKTEGCNHMTCPKCHREFCYLCGQDITGPENVTYHYRYSDCNQFEMQFPQLNWITILFLVYFVIILAPIVIPSYLIASFVLPYYIYRHATNHGCRGALRIWVMTAANRVVQAFIFLIFGIPVIIVAAALCLIRGFCICSCDDYFEATLRLARKIAIWCLFWVCFPPLLLLLFIFFILATVAPHTIVRMNEGMQAA